MLFFRLINVKMQTIVGILTFMSRKNFMLSCVEHEKRFITSGPVLINGSQNLESHVINDSAKQEFMPKSYLLFL